MRIVYKGNYIRMTCGEIGLVRLRLSPANAGRVSYCLLLHTKKTSAYMYL